MKIFAGTISRFAVVGTIGFLVDAVLLALLLALDPDQPVMWRALSMAIAVAVTFDLNANWSFRAIGARRSIAAFIRYVASQGLGLGVNFAIFAALAQTPLFGETRPLLALTIASVAAAAVTYCGARYFVFAKARG